MSYAEKCLIKPLIVELQKLTERSNRAIFAGPGCVELHNRRQQLLIGWPCSPLSGQRSEATNQRSSHAKYFSSASSA